MEKKRVHDLNIVIADDDPDDQYLMQKTIWELNPNHKITCVYNGMQLLEYLLKKGTYRNCNEPKPDCIFLDLNMPLLAGHHTLPQIRKNGDYSKIPVYIFTTTTNPEEKSKLLAMGANGVYQKSSAVDELEKNVSDILRALSPHAPSWT